MEEAKVKKKVHIDIKQFFSSLGLWICGIAINLLPVSYKVLNVWLLSEESVDCALLFWSDVDFLCINFSVAFLLFLEMFFLKIDSKVVMRILGGILIFVTLVLIVAYTVATFSPGWSTHVTLEIMQSVNFYTLLLIVVLGIIYFVISSSHIRNEVIN